MNENLIDDVVDICSSGMGGELGEWHQKELNKLFEKNLKTDDERFNFFKNQFAPYVIGSDGWMVSDLLTIKRLLKIKTPVHIWI